MKFRKRALCSILFGALMVCSALALTANVTGRWIAGSTTTAYQAGVTTDTTAYLYAKSWIENYLGEPIAEGSEHQAQNTTACYAHAQATTPSSSTTWIGQAIGRVWLTPDTAWDMGNPAYSGRYVDRYEFPSSRMSDKQKRASDELAKTLAIRDEAIIASFGLDLTDFRRIPITQLEMVEQCETVVQDIVMEIIPIYGIHAGDSRAVGLLRADNALLYIAKRDAAGVNHLYTYAPDDNDRWHLVDETTTQADAADIAAVKQANEAYQAALAEGF